MNKQRKIFVFIKRVCVFALLLSISLTVSVSAHSGRTDSSGGHRDNKNASGLGSYHYHCGGHPAHLHEGGVCPYAPKADWKLNCDSCVLIKGKTRNLKVTGTDETVSWSSSDETVATVDEKGKVTAVSKGDVVITARSGNSEKSCEVKVEAPRLNRKKVTLTSDETCKLKVSGTDQRITWSSSDKDIVSVSRNGEVSARGTGKATITAKVGGVKYRCQVAVTEQGE